MKYTIELDHATLEEAIARVKTKSSERLSSELTEIVRDVIRKVAVDEVIKMLKDDEALRKELHVSITTGIQTALAKYGEYVSTMLINAIDTKLRREYGREEE